jgi:hypothetical protein
MQIGSSLITTLRISPAEGVLKKLPPILSRESLMLSHETITGVKKAVKKLLIK